MKVQPQGKLKENENKSTDLGYRTWPSEKLRYSIYPSTAGERSGRLLPLDRYLLWVCRRGGRPGPQCSAPLRGPPRGPLSPPGTEPPKGPAPRLPDPLPPPGTRSESGLSRSRLNGLSTNNSCHSYRKRGSERDGYKLAVNWTSFNFILKNSLSTATQSLSQTGKMLWKEGVHIPQQTVKLCHQGYLNYCPEDWGVNNHINVRPGYWDSQGPYCCFMELGNINCSKAVSQSGSHRSKPVLLNPKLHILDVSLIWGLYRKAKTAALLFHSDRQSTTEAF